MFLHNKLYTNPEAPALLLGIVPYALLAVRLTVWLRTSPAVHDAFLTWADNDYELLLADADGRSLAFALFPLGPLLVLVLCLVPFIRGKVPLSR